MRQHGWALRAQWEVREASYKRETAWIHFHEGPTISSVSQIAGRIEGPGAWGGGREEGEEEELLNECWVSVRQDVKDSGDRVHQKSEGQLPPQKGTLKIAKTVNLMFRVVYQNWEWPPPSVIKRQESFCVRHPSSCHLWLGFTNHRGQRGSPSPN